MVNWSAMPGEFPAELQIRTLCDEQCKELCGPRTLSRSSPELLDPSHNRPRLAGMSYRSLQHTSVRSCSPVASSSITTRLFFTRARARLTRERSPTERLSPPLSIGDSRVNRLTGVPTPDGPDCSPSVLVSSFVCSLMRVHRFNAPHRRASS